MRPPRPLLRVVRLWEIPFVGVLAWLMFRWRMPSYALNVTDDRVYYIGTDPYYHLRALLVSLENFPRALRWDPWTFFPRGTFSGQFGTGFDQVLAGAVLLLSGGSPTREFAERALAVYPAVLGALTIIPVYLVARRMLGRPAAVWAALVLAILPGSFFTRSVAAYGDHHVAETLWSTFAVLGVLVAVERARAKEELLLDWRAAPRGELLRLAGWGALGALGLAVYVWMWPPGVLFVPILGGALAVLVGLDHARGRTSRATGALGALCFAGAALLVLPLRETGGFEVTFYTWTQPATLFLAAVALGVLAWASEALAERVRGYAFLGATVGVLIAVVLVLALALPDYFRVLRGGFEWVTGVGYTGGGRTIAEARPTELADMFREYGYMFHGAVLGLAVLVFDAFRRPRPSNVVLLVWSLFMFVAAFNQVRFNYYLAVNVALLNGTLAAAALRLVDFDTAWRNTWSPPPAPKGRRAARVERLGWKQPAAFAAVALLVVPGNVFLYDGATDCRGAKYRPVWEVADCMGPDREIQFWTDGLLWMRDHTPSAGFDIAAVPERDSFEYPPEAYGVLSWWDYGHYTQVLAERPPVANPFQQAAPFASRYLTAQTEAEAEALLAEWSPDRPVRYVLVDDATASTKFYAITVWADQVERAAIANETDYGPARGFLWDQAYRRASRPEALPDGNLVNVPIYGPEYDDSMIARLYRDDGRSLDHYRLVHEVRMTTLVGNIVDGRSGRLQAFNDILDWGSPDRMADAYGGPSYRSRGLVCVGGPDGEGGCPSEQYGYDLQLHSALKIFERVPGARIVGEAEPGERVYAFLELESRTNGRRISLERSTLADEDGRFELVVPYPTPPPPGAPDDWLLGAERGGTDATVVARGEWLIGLGDPDEPRVILAADVPERAVLEGLTVRAK